MIKAVLLDVDGVLYDSMPLHVQAWQQAFKRVKFLVPPKEVYLQEGRSDLEFVKVVLRKYRIRGVSGAAAKKIAEEKIKKFDKLKKPALIKGAKQFLSKIKRQGLKICLVTGSSQPKTLERLKQDFGISRSSVITGKEVKNSKPNPEPYLLAAKKLGIEPKDCLAIENAPLGIMSAVRAKMECIAMDSGVLNRKILLSAGAAAVYKNFGQLPRSFDRASGPVIRRGILVRSYDRIG